MHEVYVILGAMLLCFIASRLLSTETRKADFAALMRSTARNYQILILLTVTAGMGVFSRLSALQSGSGSTSGLFFITCNVLISLSAIALLCLNLAKSRH